MTRRGQTRVAIKTKSKHRNDKAKREKSSDRRVYVGKWNQAEKTGSRAFNFF